MKNKRNSSFQSDLANVTYLAYSAVFPPRKGQADSFDRIHIRIILSVACALVLIVMHPSMNAYGTQAGPNCAKPGSYQIWVRHTGTSTWFEGWDSVDDGTTVDIYLNYPGYARGLDFKIFPVNDSHEYWYGTDWYGSYEYCTLRNPAASWSSTYRTSTSTDSLTVLATYTFPDAPGSYSLTGTHNGLLAYNGTCGNNCGGHCAIPGVTFNVTVHIFQVQISNDLWWFNGENPGGGYHVQANLTAIPALQGTYDWEVINGADRVNLNNGGADSDHIVGPAGDNTIVIKSTAESPCWDDVIVRLKQGGAIVYDLITEVRAPHSLTPSAPPFTDTSLCTLISNGYVSLIHYILKDQFTAVLPYNVPVMEQFTGQPVTDYIGEDWDWGPEAGKPDADPNDVKDQIQRVRFIGFGTPTPQGPQSPLGSVKIDNRPGRIRVGSMDKTKGVIVKDNIKWQIYRDHARHE